MSSKEEKKNKKAEKESTTNVEAGFRYLLEPWVTEKSHELMSDGKYVFKVDRKAGKKQVKGEVEKVYEVTVEKVNIVNIPRKARRFGRKVGFQSGFKKAVVTLKEGDSIQLFETA